MNRFLTIRYAGSNEAAYLIALYRGLRNGSGQFLFARERVMHYFRAEEPGTRVRVNEVEDRSGSTCAATGKYSCS